MKDTVALHRSGFASPQCVSKFASEAESNATKFLVLENITVETTPAMAIVPMVKDYTSCADTCGCGRKYCNKCETQLKQCYSRLYGHADDTELKRFRMNACHRN